MITLLLCAFPAHAETALSEAEQAGLSIVQEAERRDQGWGSSSSQMQMHLRNRFGEESTRQLHNRSLEVDDDGDLTLIVFDHPKDIKGTALLSYAHALTPDQQWLYLPALKRVKRIASANKSGPFVGSEFAFEDIAAFDIDKYQYRYLRDETVNGQDCFVLSYTPLYQHSGYTRLLVWIDKSEYRQQQVEFYDRKNELLKTLVYDDYRQYLGRYWRAHTMEVVNHQTGKSTRLDWDNFALQVGLQRSDFSHTRLKRAR